MLHENIRRHRPCRRALSAACASGARTTPAGACSAASLWRSCPSRICRPRSRACARIAAAAVACDYAKLQKIALEKGNGFKFSFGAEKSAAAYWRKLEAQHRDKPLARLVKILSIPYTKNEDELALVAVGDTDKPTAANWNALVQKGVYTRAEVNRMRKGGNVYYGYRTAIHALRRLAVLRQRRLGAAKRARARSRGPCCWVYPLLLAAELWGRDTDGGSRTLNGRRPPVSETGASAGCATSVRRAASRRSPSLDAAEAAWAGAGRVTCRRDVEDGAWRRASRACMRTFAGRTGTIAVPGRRTSPRCGASGLLSLCVRAPRGALLSERAAGEVGDELRRRGVEADDVEHPRVGWVGDREAVRDHADHDQPRVDAGCAAVLAQSLGRVDVARPRLRVGVGSRTCRSPRVVRLRVQHRQRARSPVPETGGVAVSPRAAGVLTRPPSPRRAAPRRSRSSATGCRPAISIAW